MLPAIRCRIVTALRAGVVAVAIARIALAGGVVVPLAPVEFAVATCTAATAQAVHQTAEQLAAFLFASAAATDIVAASAALVLTTNIVAAAGGFGAATLGSAAVAITTLIGTATGGHIITTAGRFWAAAGCRAVTARRPTRHRLATKIGHSEQHQAQRERGRISHLHPPPGIVSLFTLRN